MGLEYVFQRSDAGGAITAITASGVRFTLDETLPAQVMAARLDARMREEERYGFNGSREEFRARMLARFTEGLVRQIEANQDSSGYALSNNDPRRRCRCVLCVACTTYLGNPSIDGRGWNECTRDDIRYAVTNLLGSARNNAFFWQECSVYPWDSAWFRDGQALAALRRDRARREQEEYEERTSFGGYREGNPVREGKGRLCGVEWEFNGADTARPIRQWAERNAGGIHSDGSCGWEAVTPPMGGRAVARILTDLAKAFHDAGAEVDERCGIHVHVDARDYMWDDMYRLLDVWSRVESAMFLLGGQARAGNHYCIPCGPMYANALGQRDRKGAILGVAYADGRYALSAREGRDVGRRNPGKKHHGRYKSLNLCPWLAGRTQRPRKPDSTIEFRLHRNSSNGWRVVGWAHLCVAIVDWCASNGDAEVRALPKDGLKALCVIAPHLKGWITRRVKAWRKAVKVRSRAILFTGGMVTRRGHRGLDAVADDGDAVASAAAE